MYSALWSGGHLRRVTVIVSLLTTPRPERELVASSGPAQKFPPRPLPLIQRPFFWAIIVALVCIVLNVIFW